MEKFLIVDGNSIMNRAFYGIRLLTNAEGLYTNAVYGFLNILFKNIDALSPDYLAVAFDLKAPTFRHKKFADYKAQRKGMPDELAVQMPVIKDVLSAMNIAVIEKEGFEADDIIGTVAKRCDTSGIECAIITGDKDDLQLVTDTTKVYLTVTARGVTTTEIYDRTAVVERYGVTPTEFIDVKGLMGDASDNIPGVRGIGEKTAFSLIQTYKNMDALYEHLEEAKLGPSAKAKLAEGRSMAYLSKELATIDTDVPLHIRWEDCRKQEPDYDALTALFTRLEFKSFLKRFHVSKAISDSEKAHEVTDEKELLSLLSMCERFEYYLFGADRKASAVAFSIGKDIYYTELPLRLFQEIFESKSIVKASHGIKADMALLRGEGIGYGTYDFDCGIAAYILDPTAADYRLSRLAMAYSGILIDDVEAYTLGEGITSRSDKLTIAALIMKALSAMKNILLTKIKENEQTDLLYEVELPLIRVLSFMEAEGFFVDQNRLEEYGKTLDSRIGGLQEAIWFRAGEVFNINSPKQLGAILFEHLKLPVVKKTKTGYSTDAETLSALSGKYEIVDSVLEYRLLAKLKGTYVDGMLPLIRDGKIYSTFHQTVTATGRISSSEPNLQNIPIRTEEGRILRKLFTAGEKGYLLIDADYSQIELRVLAHLSGDEAMCEAFREGVDIHRRTASQVFGVPEEAVTEDMRRRAKAVNFGIVYGISDFGLAKDIGVSRMEAKRYIDAYFATYPKVRLFMEESVARAKSCGFVKTMFGRRRYIPELSSSNFNTRSFGQRVAMNTPVQGTAADIIKIAMVHVSQALEQRGLKSRLILQVHDELIVRSPEEEVEEVKHLLKKEMERAAAMNVPLLAEVGCGYSWYEAK